jgi:hypothetical protein
MAIERLPGTGRGNSDQFFPCAGCNCCGWGIERLGSGGRRLTEGGMSNDLFTGVCSVGINGALPYGPGAKPWA